VKLVVAWLAVLTLTAVTTSGCSVSHRSGDYACTTQNDCKDGRTCSDGFCVVPGGSQIDAAKSDAPKPPPDAPPAICPAQCSSCNFGAKECRIDCAVKNCVGAQVVCPPGWNCDVLCSTANSCRSPSGGGTPGVTCAGTLSCNITCTGDNSCRGVACGAGPCNVDCAGGNSCVGVRCNQACSCDVTCGNNASCQGVLCTSSVCFDQLNGGCSSQLAPTCDTCPP
jgi:hypothetical protein